MALPSWHEEPIAKHHNRNAFNCGNAELNTFLATQARQLDQQGHTRTFVIVPDDDVTRVMGYYSLANSSVRLIDIPEAQRTKLPKYPEIGATLLGRLAIDREFQGQGLGRMLMLAAAEQALAARQHSGSSMLLIDAKPEAVEFYMKHDATPLVDQPQRLVLPFVSIQAAIAAKRGI